MQMIHDAVSEDRIRDFLKAEAQMPTAEQKAEQMDNELRAKRDSADEARDRAEFEAKRDAAIKRAERKLAAIS